MQESALEIVLEKRRHYMTDSRRWAREQDKGEEPDVIVDSVMNLDRFRKAKRHAYGNNYDCLCEIYEMVCDTLSPKEFEELVDETYSSYRGLLFEYAAGSGADASKLNELHYEIKQKIMLKAGRQRSEKRKEKRYKTTTAASRKLPH